MKFIFSRKIFVVFFFIATFFVVSQNKTTHSLSLDVNKIIPHELRDTFYIDIMFPFYTPEEMAYFATNVFLMPVFFSCLTNPLFAVINPMCWYIASNITTAMIARDNVKICVPNVSEERKDYVRAPFPLSFDDTMSLMQETGEAINIANVVDFMRKKVCIDFKGSKYWLSKKDCKTKFIGGITPATVCLVESNESPQLMCARISNLAPLFVNIDKGLLREPEIERDSDGNAEVDENSGEFKIKDKEYYINRLGKHCRALSSVNKVNFTRVDNSMIDNSCIDLRGDSKRMRPMMSVVAQCIHGTMLNIFTKPYRMISSSKEISEDETILTDSLYSDFDLVKYLRDEIDRMYNSAIQIDGVAFDLTSQVNSIEYNLKNRTKYLEKDFVFRDDFLFLRKSSLLEQRDYLDKLKNVIILSVQEVINQQKSSFSNDETSITYFDTIKGNLSIISMVVIVFYIMMIGKDLITGSKNLDPKTIQEDLVKILIVVYFAIGNGWKEYAINASFRMSQGLLNLFTDNSGLLSPVCDFSSKFNIVGENDECDLYTGLGSGYSPKNDNGVYKCPKKSHIPALQYERPFVPVIYQTNSGTKEINYNLVDVFCQDGQLAKLTNNNYDIENGQSTGSLSCSPGVAMEDGYRVSSLIKAGYLDESSVLNEINNNDFGSFAALYGLNAPISTAFQIKNEFGAIADIKHGNSYQDYDDKVRRQMTINAIESKRNYENYNRLYPVVNRYGITVDYSYLSIFDSIDCRLSSMMSLISSDMCNLKTDCGFRFKELNLGDILFLISLFTSLSIFYLIIIIVVMFYFVFTYFTIGLRILMSFLNAIVGITFLVLISPIVIPMSLFDKVSDGTIVDIYKKWVESFKNYLLGTIITGLSATVFLYVSDYIILGPKENIYTKMISANSNTINQDCFNDKQLWNIGGVNDNFSLAGGDTTSWIPFLPVACSLNKFSHLLNARSSGLSAIPFIGVVMSLKDTFTGRNAATLFFIALSCIIGIVVMKALEVLLSKIEDIVKDITGSKGLNSDFEKGAVGRAKSEIKEFLNKGKSRAAEVGRWGMRKVTRNASGLGKSSAYSLGSGGLDNVGRNDDSQNESKDGEEEGNKEDGNKEDGNKEEVKKEEDNRNNKAEGTGGQKIKSNSNFASVDNVFDPQGLEAIGGGEDENAGAVRGPNSPNVFKDIVSSVERNAGSNKKDNAQGKKEAQNRLREDSLEVKNEARKHVNHDDD